MLIRHRTDLNHGKWATLPQRLLEQWGVGKDLKRMPATPREAGLILIERPKGYMSR